MRGRSGGRRSIFSPTSEINPKGSGLVSDWMIWFTGSATACRLGREFYDRFYGLLTNDEHDES